MFPSLYFALLCCCYGASASAPPVLNVIAEPPSAAGSFGSADAFRDVSAVAAGLVRHAREREEAVQQAVGAVLALNASQLNIFNGIHPVALLAAQPAAVSANTPELHIQPPVQNDEDVLVELDSVMQAEQAKRKIADEIFAGDKQRMLDVERAELRRIIRDALV